MFPIYEDNPFHHSPTFSRHFTPKIYQASVLRPGRKSGNRKPSCTTSQATKHATVGRQQKRHGAFLSAMAEINRVAGGDPRSVRRAMARAKAKRNSLAIQTNADLS
jgi:hypothetical protein